MLKLRGYKMLLALDSADLGHGNYGLIVRLGAAGGEVYLLGLCADNVGDCLS